MNVSLFSIGRFHHFDLGRQILRKGHRLSLFTSNPKFKVDVDLQSFTKTHPVLRVPFAIGRWVGFGSHLNWLDEWLLKDLNRWMKRRLNSDWTDVYHALDGLGPGAGRIAREKGCLWICDRGSSHILAQRDVLREEHKLWGVREHKLSDDRLERTLAEYEEAHAITVPSHFAKKTFVERGSREQQIFVCPYGVNLSEFRCSAKGDDTFRVIHVGQITIRKGIGYLLQAMEPLTAKGKSELWLVGEVDPVVSRLLHSFRGTFEYKGICTRRHLWQMFAQASVLVVASVEEGLALVQAQAMACGVPVIATANAGAEDLFQDGVEGFIIPARNPELIREKIEWMMSNPEAREQMAIAALARVSKLGGWDHYGELVSDVYAVLVDRHGIRLHDGAVK